MNDFERVKDQIDLVRYAETNGVKLQRVGSLYKACCLWHEEKSPSLTFYPDGGFKCFGSCGVTGDVFDLAMRLHNWDKQTALVELARYAGVTLTPLTPEGKEKADKRERLYTVMSEAADYYHAMLYTGGPALDYLIKIRGLTDETIRLAKIGFAPGNACLYKQMVQLGYSYQDLLDTGLTVNDNQVRDRFSNRIMIPIRDHKGRVAGFSGRALSADHQPKYLYNTGFEKSKTIHAMPSQGGLGAFTSIVVVEGSLDPVSAANRGVFNIASQMGTSLSSEQLTLLCRDGVTKLIFCLDEDEAGLKATERLVKEHAHNAANRGVELLIMRVPSGKDPDDTFRVHPELWQAAVDAARPAVAVLIERAVSSLPVNASPIDKQALALRLLPLLKGSNEFLQEDSLTALARALGYSVEALKTWTDRQPDLRVLKSPAPLKPVSAAAPTDEHWALFYILRFENDDYLSKANRALSDASFAITPHAVWMDHCFAGLTPSDFTVPDCKALMVLVNQARTRNEPLVDCLVMDTTDTPLYDMFDRVFHADQWALAVGQMSEISLRVFLDRALCLRMARVGRDAEMFRVADVGMWLNYQSALNALQDKQVSL